MADKADMMMEDAGRQIARVYTGLAKACAVLPLPITLPTGVVASGEIIPAVRRIVQIIGEIPLPDDQRAELFAAAVYWLAAVDLYHLCLHEVEESRAAGVMGVLMMADEAVHGLAEWLLGNRD
ncbi:hypothetical protein AB0P17_36555 [Streptomyces sp. NPDC088124]|uniref:hypothetical protein n=1 Tax=Streptomyces sp. NPDC088124 TaxID=3154654 RepID=UPI00342C06C6